ncbi:MAG: HAMP domain-containing histidine kinase [Deltaproteobacteria bacterium]|nr:HAMP domain-containing histidine kinase [Deltaproteobacteria bacterium]
MTIQTIIIEDRAKKARPIVKLAGPPPGSVWEYSNLAFPTLGGQDIEAADKDLNMACQSAAKFLAEKVSDRQIRVELIIDPLIPPLNIETERLVPIVMDIAENASASVEPGPGTVILRTWWRDQHTGVDAVGLNGVIPSAVRQSLMRPGFSTRVADWDTGFGLHAAVAAAEAIAARVELFEPNDGIGFRLAIPIRSGTPLSPAETTVGLENDKQKESPETWDKNWPPLTLWGPREVVSDVCTEESIEA